VARPRRNKSEPLGSSWSLSAVFQWCRMWFFLNIHAGFSATPFFTPQNPRRFSLRMWLHLCLPAIRRTVARMLRPAPKRRKPNRLDWTHVQHWPGCRYAGAWRFRAFRMEESGIENSITYDAKFESLICLFCFDSL